MDTYLRNLGCICLLNSVELFQSFYSLRYFHFNSYWQVVGDHNLCHGQSGASVKTTDFLAYRTTKNRHSLWLLPPSRFPECDWCHGRVTHPHHKAWGRCGLHQQKELPVH